MPMGIRHSGRKQDKAWGRLSEACRKTHKWLYRKNNRDKALKHLPKIESLLSALPEDEMAIVRWEGYALYHELRGEYALALEYRLREIELMEMLYEHIEKMGYEKDTTIGMRQRRDRDALEERHKIAEALNRQIDRKD